MPVKVHVKGKRKAPLPPTTIKPATSNGAEASPEASPTENVKKKLPAPPPPSPPTTTSSRQLDAMKHLEIVSKIDINIEPNNLSAVGNKLANKIYETKTIFNIVEPKHIKNNLRTSAYRPDEPILTKFSSAFVNVYNNNNNDVGTKEVWNCEHCTLENPFWKIVCSACDRIRPYGLPTHIIPNNSNSFSLRTNDAIPSTSDLNEGDVKLRRKASINGINFDTLSSKRSSLEGIIQPYAVGPVPIEPLHKNDQNNSAKKRASMIAINDYTMNTLEMEKQRLRAVIRSMNSRALAEKYPIEKPNNIDISAAAHKYETLNLNVNGMEKNREKELNGENGPSNAMPATDIILLTDDAKAEANRGQTHIDGGTGAKAQPNDTYYDFVGNLATYCDQTPLGGTMRKLEAEIVQDKPTKNNANQVENLRFIDETAVYDLVINLYVNFNNAIGVNVRRTMTLPELKEYVSAHIVPCRNPKIYFNGLLMQKDQTLAEYGIKERSSLYINTENITVDVDNVHRNMKPSRNEKPKAKDELATTAVEPIRIVEKNRTKNIKPLASGSRQFEFPKENDAQPTKFQIEHIQLNRFTIEKINPENVNITKTKYRGVYNYNPRCNPNVVFDVQTDLLRSAVAKPTHEAMAMLSENLSNVKPSKSTKVSEEASNHYLELLSLDNLNDIAVNTEAFECAVCFVDYEPTEGAVLRNCLHIFCKDCIRNTIIYSDEAEVKCPYIDTKYTCDCILQDREIKALLTKTEHDEHLAKSLRVAENQIENSFHCRTPNCAGWCIYEDNVNQYKCVICNLVNCLTCRVIHDGLNCAQYQDMVKNNLEGNPENAITKHMLDEMIKNGEAMNCPTCRVVLMKKWGCDWLKCSMCKTEICWVTRGSRWGPAGKGDITGGCKCGVDGFKCHPKCNYCH